MTRLDCEEYCISHLLSLNNVKYCEGLFSEEGLFVKGEWLFSIHKNENSGYDRYEYNMKTNEFKMSKKENEESEFTSIDTPGIESNCVIDESNNGMRWEGSCLNQSPFGYICTMNESNELIYRGVMIGDKKECFGIDYYPDHGQIEYIGCYYNNKRHGFGMLYDRKGELVFEGDWLYGSNEYDMNVILKDSHNDDDSSGSRKKSGIGSSDDERKVILKDIDDERMVNSLIHELVIDAGVGNECKGDLLLCGFLYLERLVVKKNSLKNVNSLKISDNPVLKSFEIESAYFRTAKGLSTLKPVGYTKGSFSIGAFSSVKSVVIESMMIYD